MKLSVEGAGRQVDVRIEEGRKVGHYQVNCYPRCVMWWNPRRDSLYTLRTLGGQPVSCDCPAGKHGMVCKHRRATADLMTDRILTEK